MADPLASPAHPRLVSLTMEVLGPDIFPLNGGGFFMKPPRYGGEVPWHQDASPFDGSGGIPVPVLFDFWLGVDAAGIDNGCMELIPGSHLLGRLEHEARRGGERGPLFIVQTVGQGHGDNQDLRGPLTMHASASAILPSRFGQDHAVTGSTDGIGRATAWNLAVTPP